MDADITKITAQLARTWKSLTSGELTLLLPGYVPYGDRIEKIPPSVKNILQGESDTEAVIESGNQWWVVKQAVDDGEIAVVAWSNKEGPWGALLPSWATLIARISVEKTVSHDLAVELVKAWDRLTFHFEMTKIIGRTTDLNEMLDSIVISLTEVLGRGQVFLAIENDEGDISIITSGIKINLSSNVYQDVTKSHKPLSFSDIREFVEPDDLIQLQAAPCR